MTKKPQKHVLYECGICDQLHRWEFDGDCWIDAERFSDEIEYCDKTRQDVRLQDIEVRSWDDRQNADKGGK